MSAFTYKGVWVVGDKAMGKTTALSFWHDEVDRVKPVGGIEGSVDFEITANEVGASRGGHHCQPLVSHAYSNSNPHS